MWVDSNNQILGALVVDRPDIVEATPIPSEVDIAATMKNSALVIYRDKQTGALAYSCVMPADIKGQLELISEHPASELTRRTIHIVYSAFLMLECVNVDVVEKPAIPSWHQAHGVPHHEVIIHQRSHRSMPSGSKRDIDWSHRWEVRGHFKHMGPDTREYKAAERNRPEKIIDVSGRGLCVRKWCPPFIKGPEDKPFVPKLRKVQP
jgi:hypothetical protein